MAEKCCVTVTQCSLEIRLKNFKIAQHDILYMILSFNNYCKR